MKKIIFIVLLMFAHSSWAQEKLDVLLDGLHQDAHEGNFQTYFARYTSDAIFLGTDKTERWTIKEFKAYAKPAFEDGHGWTYSVVERNWEGDGNTRWFDEILFNEKLGHCRGTGVVQLINGEWKIAKRQGVHDWVRFEPANEKGQLEAAGPTASRSRQDPAYQR